MTAWTVQCGYATYYANTVTVEAETLDAALAQAIEIANDDPSWRALDDCGPTFIDAVAEGVDADPWRGFASAIPVPDRFTEDGEPPLLIVVLAEGRVKNIAIEHGRARVVVRDYDADVPDSTTLDTDESRDRRAVVTSGNELPPRGG